MQVDRYCEDGLLFDVVYLSKYQEQGFSRYMFSINDTEESVKKILISAPYYIDVIEVSESGYILKLKNTEI